MKKFRTIVSVIIMILCGSVGLYFGGALNNAIGGCILGVLTNHAKNSPTSIGGEMNWHKKLSLDHRKKIEYT